MNTVFHDPVAVGSRKLAASSILLPVLPSIPRIGKEPGCGERIGIPCFTPAMDAPASPG
jgi:hypothetical protein